MLQDTLGVEDWRNRLGAWLAKWLKYNGHLESRGGGHGGEYGGGYEGVVGRVISLYQVLF